MPHMLKLVHVWGSYLYLLIFLISCGLCGLSIRHKQDAGLERLSAWSFVASFVVLAVAYFCGFTPEAELADRLPQVVKLATRHHDLAKFALTGMMLVAAASLTVLIRFRKQRFPGWFLPNILFLCLMVMSFSFVSMTFIWKFENHPQKNQIAPPIPSASPTPYVPHSQ